MTNLPPNILILNICGWLALCSCIPSMDPPAKKISFDPKSVKIGDAWGLSGGLNDVKIKVLDRTSDKCLFEYSNIGCGGVGILERIELPIDAGLVEADLIEKYFPKSAKVYYSRSGAGIRALVPGTDEFVEFDLNHPRSEMFPQLGDKIKFRYQVFDSPTFEKHLATADFTQRVEFEAGSDQVWPWLVLVMEGMSVGDEQHVRVPVSVAAGAVKWLREPEKSKTLYATIRLVSIEPAQK